MQRKKERMISFGEESHSHSRAHLLYSLRRNGVEKGIIVLLNIREPPFLEEALQEGKRQERIVIIMSSSFPATEYIALP